MRPEQKTKSRSKLYNLVNGYKEFTGAAGQTSTWTITFSELAAATDTLVIGGYYFKYVADGSEDYTKAGTLADPVLVSIGGTPTATTAAANLVTALHAFAGTSAWGFLHPVDATGASNSSGVVTIITYPGIGSTDAFIPDATFTGADPTIARTVTGTATVPTLSTDVKWNIIDTTGFSTVNKQYYQLKDGNYIGEQCNVMIKTITTSDTPTILGSLTDGGTDQVEALFAATEDSNASFVWNGTRWTMVVEDPAGTITYDAAS